LKKGIGILCGSVFWIIINSLSQLVDNPDNAFIFMYVIFSIGISAIIIITVWERKKKYSKLERKVMFEPFIGMIISILLSIIISVLFPASFITTLKVLSCSHYIDFCPTFVDFLSQARETEKNN